jgi:hypothetical protein
MRTRCHRACVCKQARQVVTFALVPVPEQDLQPQRTSCLCCALHGDTSQAQVAVHLLCGLPKAEAATVDPTERVLRLACSDMHVHVEWRPLLLL